MVNSMTFVDELIGSTLEAAQVPGRRRREAIAEELRSHLEDMIEDARRSGLDGPEAEQWITGRFGNPGALGRAFSDVYRWENLFVRAGALVILALTCLGAISLLVYGAQCVLSVGLGVSPALIYAPQHWRWENELLAGLTLGYLALYFAERLFTGWRFLKAVAFVGGTFAAVAGIAQGIWPGLGPGIAIAFACALMVRLAQIYCPRSWLRLAAFSVFFLAIGTLLHQSAINPSRHSAWLFVLPIGLSVALSCQMITILAARFDQKFLRSKFA